MHGFIQWYVTTLPRDFLEWIAYPLAHHVYQFLRL